MKSLCYVFAFILLLSGCKENKLSVINTTVNISEDIVIPKKYIVTKSQSSIVIDGLDDDKSWESALFTDSFVDIEGVKIPKFNTKVKMLWDEKFLYVYCEMQEPHIWGNLKQRDTIMYYNNDFEVFLDPSGTGMRYGEIEINALGTVWDLFLDKPYRVGGNANFEWNLNELKSAVYNRGTINNSDDIDSLWSVEMAIPLTPLIALKSKPITSPKEGEQWRVNFSRVQWDHDVTSGEYHRKKRNGQYLPEYNWVWSNQKVINMHEPEKWGILQFSLESTANKIDFNEDEDLLAKQVAFALFRKTRYGSLSTLLSETVGYTQMVNTIYSPRDSLYATFFKTNFGFEYKLKNSHNGHTFIINEQGILKRL
jgi:hypothetical protein